ncbi:MAG: DUF3489 domain-containing protein [Rhizobiaceae bacterium]|nr:DUF3489 domain-containing protein [Rhizobiaceae bacterium]
MTTIKTTDVQRAVLEAAAAREGGYAWPLPEALGLKKGSAVLVTKALLGKGLVKERRAKAGEPVWREDEKERPMTVLISHAGLAAIGTGALTAATSPKSADAAEADQRRMPRAGTKLAILVALLTRDEGATVEEMVTATGWQAHTTRGVMSGVLSKRFGLAITSEKIEGRGRVYRTSEA